VAFFRSWRERIEARGGDGTSSVEIALAMLEGEDVSLFSRNFDSVSCFKVEI
jgi:hypothetical protein